MANKNILVSSNGKYEPISASVDDATGVLSSSLPVTANTASFVGQSGLMQVYDGKLIPVGNSSVSNPQENYSGSVLGYDASEGFSPSRTGDVSFSGDISGNTVSGIKVRSVSNVTGGVLQTLHGGTGTGSFSANSLITTSGSGLIPADANKIVVSGPSTWQLLPENSLQSLLTNPIFFLYTGAVGTNNTYVFTKPDKARFIRVICQGGGGAGGYGPALNYSPGTYAGGGGGGGGGYSDCTFAASAILYSVNITCGAGGVGGSAYTAATSGNSSLFGNFLYAGGGVAGDKMWQNKTTAFGGAGGAGYTYNGGRGGNSVPNANGDKGGSVFMGAAGGGGGGSNNRRAGGAGGDITSVSLTGGAGGTAGTSSTRGGTGGGSNTFLYWKTYKYYLNNVYIPSGVMPKIIASGGGGGGGGDSDFNPNGGQSGNGLYGSGGGGGGPGGVSHYSGNGGPGYVLIICY